MEHDFRMSDAQVINLTMIAAIQASLRHDEVSAAYKFLLSPEMAKAILAIDYSQLPQVVANLPHTSLFVPRADLVDLLKAPPALAPALAAARANIQSAKINRPVERRVGGGTQ